MRKPVYRVSDQVRHKLGCTASGDSLRLEISDLGRRGIALSTRGLNVKHFYNGVVQVQDHFRYGFVEIDM